MHNTVWENLLWPLIGRIERHWIFHPPQANQVNEECTTLGHVVKNVRLSQVPKDDILFVKEIHRLRDVLHDEGRNQCLVCLELPKGFPVHTVHNHVQAADDAPTKM